MTPRPNLFANLLHRTLIAPAGGGDPTPNPTPNPNPTANPNPNPNQVTFESEWHLPWDAQGNPNPNPNPDPHPNLLDVAVAEPESPRVAAQEMLQVGDEEGVLGHLLGGEWG